MNFDRASIEAIVKRLAAKMLPGWTIELQLAASVDEIGCLGMIEPIPQRSLAKLWLAPHPPEESLEETIAHELTHAMLSPLTHLLPPSGSVVMIEERIVEPLGIIVAKAIDALPNYARAMLRAIHNPRTESPALRKRISALAIGRRNETRKRMDPKALAALAMEGGQFAAMDGLPSEVAEWIKKVIEAMAGGGAEPASARENENAEPAAPAMREEDMPPQYRAMFRSAKRSATMMLADTIRLRLHTARTVDGVVLDPDVEKDLAACDSIEQFEREFKLVKRMASKGNEQQRNRSGALPPEDKGDKVAAGFSIDELTKDGLPRHVAQMIHDESRTNLEAAKKMRTSARARIARESAKNGGAR